MGMISKLVAIVALVATWELAVQAQPYSTPYDTRPGYLFHKFERTFSQDPDLASGIVGSATRDVILINRAIAKNLPGSAMALQVGMTMNCATHEVALRYQSYDASGIALDNSQAVFDELRLLAPASSDANNLRNICESMMAIAEKRSKSIKVITAVKPHTAESKPPVERWLPADEELYPAIVDVRGALSWALAQDDYLAALSRPQHGRFIVTRMETSTSIFDFASREESGDKLRFVFYQLEYGALVRMRVRADCMGGVYVTEDTARLTDALMPETLEARGQIERRFDGGKPADSAVRTACALPEAPENTIVFESLADAVAQLRAQSAKQ